jgi:hypothetical protein
MRRARTLGASAVSVRKRGWGPVLTSGHQVGPSASEARAPCRNLTTANKPTLARRRTTHTSTHAHPARSHSLRTGSPSDGFCSEATSGGPTPRPETQPGGHGARPSRALVCNSSPAHNSRPTQGPLLGGVAATAHNVATHDRAAIVLSPNWPGWNL